MQFNLGLLTSTILVAVSPVLGAGFVWHADANCTGEIIARNPNAKAGDCVFLKNGGSAKSIRFSGVPHQADFFVMSGKPDEGTDARVVKKSRSGCAIRRFNLESFSFS
ncbi:hypothetical protein FB45DRAFT_907056 [Roridomyces roridus]|uniref:Uncharacterized protein n=1 Tax=Roridomyces roridus TaxID=1738132 RepID=A0AAD7C1K9_9AGAR|nr:hypothetical protein FB45DRAFT_907056 [Roridomyces roridus]